MQKTKPVKMSERQLESYVIDVLLLDGWRVFRTDAQRYHREGNSVRHPLGEPGMADLLCLRYGGMDGMEQVLWIEMKAPGGSLAPHQERWHAAERKRGARTAICGQDFAASPESFREWYEATGLCMRKLR